MKASFFPVNALCIDAVHRLCSFHRLQESSCHIVVRPAPAFLSTAAQDDADHF